LYFQGYNNYHLGYRCLDLLSNHIYLARHVRFHKNIFPFDKSKKIIALPTQPSAATLHPLTPPYPVTHLMPHTLTTTLLAHLPLPAYHCHDHSSGVGSDSPHLHAFSIFLASSPNTSHAGSPAVVVSPLILLLVLPLDLIIY